jgi:hypothetical protein
MPNENLHTLSYRILRYTPNLVRDEWVNIGVLLEDPTRRRLGARLVEEPAELARVRRIHPNADEELLRALPRDFESQIAAAGSEPAAYLAKLDETMSNVLQLGPQKAVLAEDFEAELDRLYRDHVAPPRRARPGLFENTRAWIRTRINEVFRRSRILDRMERGVRVEEFTQPGDPLRLDYAYRYNGTRGYLHALSLARDPAQSKVLAYTAECVRAKIPASEFTAITEVEPHPDNARQQFIARLLAEQKIEILPVARLDALASRLRPRLQ